MSSFADAKKSAEGLLDFLEYCEEEYAKGQKRLKVAGEIMREAAEQPGLIGRFDQLRAELRALKSIHERKLKKQKGELWRHYLENYNRTLASKDIDQYIMSDQRYQNAENVVAEIEVIYDKMSGLVENLRAKGWSISYIVKLRSTGLEDALV
jgi:hypothetical protein